MPDFGSMLFIGVVLLLLAALLVFIADKSKSKILMAAAGMSFLLGIFIGGIPIIVIGLIAVGAAATLLNGF